MVIALRPETRWIFYSRDSSLWWILNVRLKSQPIRLPAAVTSQSQESAVIKAAVTELKDCIDAKNLELGRALHSQAIRCGWDLNKYVANTLITMYCKCGSMHDARDTFNSFVNRDVVSWTALIVGYADNGYRVEALDLFNTMDCPPNRITFACVLKACAGLATEGNLEKQACLQKGLGIHRRARELGVDQGLAVASTLVDLYSKCGEMNLARKLFDEMAERDAILWTVLLLGYVENGHSVEALKLFGSMDCAPNSVTFIAVVKACAALACSGTWERNVCLERGADIHRQARELGCDKDVTLANTLLDMYGKCRDIALARKVFNEMKDRTATSWTTLILGYVENGQCNTALEVFSTIDCLPDKVTFVAALKACSGAVTEAEKESFLRRGVGIHKQAADLGLDRDLVVGNTLMDMYGKLGVMSRAREVFDRMTQRNVISWTALMHGYVDNGESHAALKVYDCMDCAPNAVTFVAALKACAGSDKERGLSLHKRAREFGFDRETAAVANTLVYMYSKCRAMALARGVFDEMQHRNAVSWNVLILGYVENGEASVALEMYNSMDAVPNRVTFVVALKACACAGALETGRRIYSRVRQLGLEQDEMIASCLVDFFGKCGDSGAADEVFSRIQSRDVVCWNALIGVYSHQGDVSRVMSLVKMMQESGVKVNSVTMMLILTACSHAGMVEEGQRQFESMQKYSLSPTLEHYNCLVDMLGRANKLDEAVSTIENMPLKANAVTWKTLLGACKKWNNLDVGKVAFDALASLKDKDEAAVAYVLMGDIYGSLGSW